MVISFSSRRARQRGAALLAELAVAVAILGTAVIPLGYSIYSEKTLAHSCYERAVAMEIVDGEMEVLAAGGWRAFPQGPQNYAVHSLAAANLPPGKFVLTIESGKVRLEWQPDGKHHGGAVVREAWVK